MGMLVSIHQPDYLPWVGFFNKIKVSDVFVFLDGASYSRNGFHNRNRVRTPQGWAYLTIPVPRKEQFKPMNQVLLPEDISWAKKHFRTLEMNYSRTQFWKLYKDFLEDLYTVKVKEAKTLAEFNMLLIRWACEQLGITTKLVLESEMEIDHELKATDWLLAICQKLGATKYLSGVSGPKYLEMEKFEAANIKVDLQNFEPQVYEQQFDGEFIKGLAIVDLLCNLGPDAKNYI